MKYFFSHCDTLIKDWLSSSFITTGTYKNDPFLSVQKKPNGGLLQPKYINLMPEPFWGDPGDPDKKNLAVMLNLNPGYGNNDHKYIGKTAVAGSLSNGYPSFAKTNPYLTNPSFHPDAYDWWQKRLAWLKSIFGEGEELPFVLELCPWHSHNWSEAGIVQFNKNQIDHIEKYVLLPAQEAVKNSVSGCIFSIGKVYTRLYPELGFKLVKEWEPDSSNKNWPTSPKTKKPKNVHFKYYKKDTETGTIKVLSIWIWGSNKTPCSEFLDIEKEIVEYIRTH